jgi:glucan phosphoethanolaminetransferase (alkaline phosphatase superfamily)
MDNVADRLLNPGVVVSMIGAGIAYAWLLWSLNIRPNLNLFVVSVAPGVLFLVVIWSIRSMQGVSAATYVALLADWLIFSNSAFVTVLIARRWRRRKGTL